MSLKAEHIEGSRYRVYGSFFFEYFDCVVDLETNTTTHPKSLAPTFFWRLINAAKEASKQRQS